LIGLAGEKLEKVLRLLYINSIDTFTFESCAAKKDKLLYPMSQEPDNRRLFQLRSFLQINKSKIKSTVYRIFRIAGLP
jgi:hypothetical protein